MASADTLANTTASVEQIQREWHELTSRVNRLELEKIALDQENKALRFLLERVIDHRQKSHSELVLLLSGLISKLPLNDLGAIVGRLVWVGTGHWTPEQFATAVSKADRRAAGPNAPAVGLSLYHIEY